MKILVVEDEPRLGEQIIETLEGADWVPELSQDGIDALYRATSLQAVATASVTVSGST